MKKISAEPKVNLIIFESNFVIKMVSFENMMLLLYDIERKNK